GEGLIDATSNAGGVWAPRAKTQATRTALHRFRLILCHFAQLGHAAYIHPLHHEDVARMVEAGAVRADEFAWDEFIARLIAQRKLIVSFMRIAQMFDDLVVLVHQRDAAI